MPRFAFLGCVLVLLGCEKKTEPTPKPDTVASTSASAAAEEDPATKKKVTKDDCARWAAHAVDVLVSSVKESASGCPTVSADALVQKFESQRVSIQKGATESCEKHLDEPYTLGDGRCFLRSKNAKELVACKLAPMAPQEGDSDLSAMVDGIRATCAKMAASASASAPPK